MTADTMVALAGLLGTVIVALVVGHLIGRWWGTRKLREGGYTEEEITAFWKERDE